MNLQQARLKFIDIKSTIPRKYGRSILDGIIYSKCNYDATRGFMSKREARERAMQDQVRKMIYGDEEK